MVKNWSFCYECTSLAGNSGMVINGHFKNVKDWKLTYINNSMVPQPEAQDMLYFFHDAGWTVCCSIDFGLKCNERKFMNLMNLAYFYRIFLLYFLSFWKLKSFMINICFFLYFIWLYSTVYFALPYLQNYAALRYENVMVKVVKIISKQ